MCSREKNECFCKPGYVAIQESFGLTCKTLLTNLKCQVDNDCVHVTNSICHPGAGYCACPSGTIYVPQQHTCFPMTENDESPFCHHCRQINGACYNNGQTISGNNTQTPQEEVSTDENYEVVGKWLKTFPYGCKCPYNTAMPLAIPKSHVTVNNMTTLGSTNSSRQLRNSVPYEIQLPQWSFCKAILVNIGEFCNHIDLLCRAKNAMCTTTSLKSSASKIPRCTCKEGYIPVFQYHLGYHECFQQIPTNRSACLHCTRTGGKCYTMNEHNPLATGCKCPNHRTSTFSNLDIRDSNSEDPFSTLDSDHNMEGCAESLAEVSCFRNYVELCYKTPQYPPYNTLSSHLIKQRSIAFVSDSRIKFDYRPECALALVPAERIPKHQRSETADLNTRIWCVQLDWRKQEENPPCGLRVTEYMSGHLYSGYLTILTNPEFASNMENLFFRFTCKTNNEIPQQVPGQIFEHQPHSSAPLTWDNLPWSHGVHLTMELHNISGSPVQTVFELTPIRLYTRLDDQSGPYKAMQIEDCYMYRIPNAEHNPNTVKGHMIISKSCPRPEFLVRPKLKGGALRSQDILTSWYSPVTRHETPLFYFSRVLNSACSYVGNCSINNPERTEHSGYSSASRNIDSSHSTEFENSEDSNRSFRTEHQVHQIELTCTFRMCTDHAWCSWPKACNPADTDPQPPRTTFVPPTIQTVSKSLRVNVIKLVMVAHTPAKTKETSTCTTIFCETGLHIPILLGMVGVLTCLMGLLGLLLARRYQHQCQQRRQHHAFANKRIRPLRPNSLGIAPVGSHTASAQCSQVMSGRLSCNSTSLVERNNQFWFNLHTYSNPMVTGNLTQSGRQLSSNSLQTASICSCGETVRLPDTNNRSPNLSSCREGRMYRSSARTSNTMRKNDRTSMELIRPIDVAEITRNPPVPLTFPINGSSFFQKKPHAQPPQPFRALHTEPNWMHTEINAMDKSDLEFGVSDNLHIPTYLSAIRVDSDPASQCDPLSREVHS